MEPFLHMPFITLCSNSAYKSNDYFQDILSSIKSWDKTTVEKSFKNYTYMIEQDFELFLKGPALSLMNRTKLHVGKNEEQKIVIEELMTIFFGTCYTIRSLDKFVPGQGLTFHVQYKVTLVSYWIHMLTEFCFLEQNSSSRVHWSSCS